MGELKQRRKSNRVAATDGAPRQEAAAATPPPKPRTIQQQEQPWKKLALTVLLIAVYIPILIVVNPSTIPSVYYRITRPACKGVCSIQEENYVCGPVDSDRLVFLRIPKTASTTVLKMFERGFLDKSVAVTDLFEVPDLTSSLEVEVAGLEPMGYHDPSPEAYQERIEKYYTHASKSILYPPYRAQERTLFEGHLYFFNFTKNAVRLVGPETLRWLPTWLRRWYHLERPAVLTVQQFTFLRNPQDRVKSMYYYDRHDARTEHWRERFVEKMGNATLQECLLDPSCVQVNQLQKWCSIQVEMLCGVGNKCRPATRHSLEIAKQRLDDSNAVLFAGITERLEESFRLLQKLLPTYLEGVSVEDMPRAKESSHITRRETQFSPQAQAVLDQVCALDMELYKHANQLLTERIQKCQ